MAKTFNCSIVTPTKAVLEDEVTYVTFEAWDGQRGVIHGQSPTLTKLGIGTARLDFPEGGHRWYLLEEGFAQVDDNNLTLLTNAATAAESLTERGIDAELAEANARVTQHGEDQQQVERDQKRALAKKAMLEIMQARGHAI